MGVFSEFAPDFDYFFEAHSTRPSEREKIVKRWANWQKLTRGGYPKLALTNHCSMYEAITSSFCFEFYLKFWYTIFMNTSSQTLTTAKPLGVAGGSLIISGTCIGAGMLAIPVVTAQAGFLPSLVILA